MKKILLGLALAAAFSGTAQTTDSVNTIGNSMDVYYNLNDGSRTATDKQIWDIGFTTAGFDVAVTINENKETALYLYSSDTSEWGTVDTSSFNFNANRLYNSNESWEVGAFNNMGSGHPDYGWGTYSSNHYIYGSRIFLVQTSTAIYKVLITELSLGGIFTFKYSTLNGSDKVLHIDKANYDTKNFVGFDLDGNNLVEHEPNSSNWHLLFTKYNAADQSGYLVSGVKVNKGLMVAERSGMDVSSNDTLGLSWTDNITEIGYNWKTFNLSTFEYELTADLVYFVKNEIGDVWKIWFTAYSGGKYNFNTYKISSNAGVNVPDIAARIFPNPSSEYFTIKTDQQGQGRLSLYNIRGQQVFSTQTLDVSYTTLDVAAFTPGVYFIQIDVDGLSTRQKLIIE